MIAVNGVSSLVLDALFRKQGFRFLPVLPRSQPLSS